MSRDHSATVGLTPDEVDALLAAAAADTGPAAIRHRAVLAFLADLGLRVGELVGLDVTDIGAERGHRSIRFVGKGGKSRRRALTPAAAAALDDYLAARGHPADGPLFVTAHGARIDRHAVFRLVRRLAQQAGIPGADRLSPHSLRHAFATTARDGGRAAGGRAGRDGPRRPAHHPPLRPRPAQPGPRPGVHDRGGPGPPRATVSKPPILDRGQRGRSRNGLRA